MMNNEQLKDSNKLNIDEYFFVNLDRRKDRLAFITNQISKSKILTEKIKKWTAVDGRDVNPNWMPRKMLTKKAYEDILSDFPTTWGLSVTPGALGFYLTHTKIFEYALSENKIIFIMDDDVDVSLNFDTEINEILNELPDTFDFCYLGYFDTPHEKIHYSKKLFIPRGQFCGPHGYILSPKGAKKLLDLIFPIDIQLDSKLYTIQGDIEYYAAYDRLTTFIEAHGTDSQGQTGCIKNYEKTNTIQDFKL